MAISSGAKKELLILFFCKAIFQVALEHNTIGSIPRERLNKAYIINNRIDRRIKSLVERITATIDATITPDIAEWMHSKTRGVLFSVLMRIAQKDIQLETFAFYMIFVNFCERKQKLDDIFIEYTDANLLFDTVDLLKLTNITEELEADMMNLAYKVCYELKG